MEFKYMVIINHNTSIPVTAEETQAILKAADKNRAYVLERTGEVISLRPFPSIVQTERILGQERKKLETAGKYRCRYGNIHRSADICACREGDFPNRSSEKEDMDLIKENEALRSKHYMRLRDCEGYAPMLEKMTIPKLSFEEKLAAQVEEGSDEAIAIREGKYEEYLLEEENRKEHKDD